MVLEYGISNLCNYVDMERKSWSKVTLDREVCNNACAFASVWLSFCAMDKWNGLHRLWSCWFFSFDVSEDGKRDDMMMMDDDVGALSKLCESIFPISCITFKCIHYAYVGHISAVGGVLLLCFFVVTTAKMYIIILTCLLVCLLLLDFTNHSRWLPSDRRSRSGRRGEDDISGWGLSAPTS